MNLKALEKPLYRTSLVRVKKSATLEVVLRRFAACQCGPRLQELL